MTASTPTPLIARSPWAFVAHKDGRLGGVTIADGDKKGLAVFLGEFAADGFTITTVFNRDEYEALIAPMQFGSAP